MTDCISTRALCSCARLASSATPSSPFVWRSRPALAKVVATIGPASEQLPVLQQVVSAGMRIMRINFSHATYEEADLRVHNLRQARGIGARAAGLQLNLRSVMLDTQGPEIRTGSFADGVKEVLYNQRVSCHRSQSRDGCRWSSRRTRRWC